MSRKVDKLIREFFQPKRPLLESLVKEELDATLNLPPVVEETVPLVIDLGVARDGKLNEDWLYQFGGWIETLLGSMFGQNNITATIRGTKSEVDSFMKTLNGEKRYIDAYRRYGLDNPRVQGSRTELTNAVKNFERSTNLKWPFKG